jgi:hypothetical protein
MSDIWATMAKVYQCAVADVGLGHLANLLVLVVAGVCTSYGSKSMTKTVRYVINCEVTLVSPYIFHNNTSYM